MKLSIIIPTHNRPQYAEKCFKYLESANVPHGTVITVVDDASREQMPFLSIPHKYIKHEKNTGIRGAILTGIAANEADIYMVIDSDVVLKPHAISRMLEIHKETGLMVSGINCIQSTPEDSRKLRNPLLSVHAGYHVKQLVAGQCIIFSKEQYREYVEPVLHIVGNWDYEASKRTNGIAVTVPSVAQHIGIQSSMGHNAAPPDRACDFKFLSLPDVTLFGIDSYDPAGILRAADISQQDIEYGAVNIITNDLFTKGGSRDVRIRDYSKFMIKELTNYFNTSHVLTIHGDGYVVNWEAWSNEWLQYDYIGSTWWFKDGMNVGNGGFSLRSKKLCNILSEYEMQYLHPEDECICRIYRPALEKLGIKFAPEEVANKFGIEAYSVPAPYNSYSGQFGFHGVHVTNVPNGLPPKITARNFVRRQR